VALAVANICPTELLGSNFSMKILVAALPLFLQFAVAQRPSLPKSQLTWELKTNLVRREISLEGGQFSTKTWIDAKTEHDLLKGLKANELSIIVDGKELTGLTDGWTLISQLETPHQDGSHQLDLTVRHGNLEVTKSYVTYPGTSIIREWMALKNVGSIDMAIENPSFLTSSVKLGGLDRMDFLWMTGGENRAGSWLLEKETLKPGVERKFDSYDPFPGAADSKFEFKMGSASYAPWFALYDRSSRQGLFIGFDYFGRWASTFAPQKDGAVNSAIKLAGYRVNLPPGGSITTPKAFTGLYADDLDNAGNEVLDWQYQYLWDYTRTGWFPAIRMLGFWWNGTPWKDPGNSWVGGNGDADSAFRKVFRIADLMSEVGADVYHRDWGWWDHAGDWNGPDFKTMGAYLQKRGMGQLIYAFIYTVDPHSKLAQLHPNWIINDTLDMSNPAVVTHLNGQLDDFAKRFGPFEWRNDSTPTAPHGKDDAPLLAQDQAFREILRRFLDDHPEDAFQGVNGGGNDAGYDYARYASSISFSDGAVGILRNYWEALILPPDKSSDIPDNWQPDKFDKNTWHGLLTINFDMTGDTWDPEKLEGIRQLIDIYHYLQSQGLVGRWVQVYRPVVDGDDPTMYFERLKKDGSQGIIIIKRSATQPVTIKPKGLNAKQQYQVSFQESDRRETKSGADLMETGILMTSMAPGELIYLGVPYHPGSHLYRTSPSAPSNVKANVADNFGYPGVELNWAPARDDHWVSYYEVYRDGTLVDKVAKGTYYFDHSVGADLAALYSVRAVNGGGLRSSEGTAVASYKPHDHAIAVDDAELSFSGKWQKEQSIQPAYRGTLSSSDRQGDAFTYTMTGSQFVWFTRLCGECGQAAVSVDGGEAVIVDTYSADDIFGVGIYSKTFPASGIHQIKITVAGKHGGPRGTGTRVYVDGLRIEK